ncbi:Stromal interaction molecule -like protein [Trichinella pseudospiralis]|uniref:Stromal interaction molecule-like protein n=1 Tax=Trichinella pseudospiralis TaxID=6337 RepID=A0A0V1HJY4_TRIPS|nr:Stromal interaction molecule -like protein [Trichinella pseudospiralis]KRZ39279.1 Stromal interaction molecule -like protein [Trichinella pseudospiralis]
MCSLFLKCTVCILLLNFFPFGSVVCEENFEDVLDAGEMDKSKIEDPFGYEAIKLLHRKMDDDRSGSVDLNESIDFVKEELQIQDKDRVVRRQKVFHQNNDEYITVDDLWYRWILSEVRCWNVDQTINWLINVVELPQYKEIFEKFLLNGTSLPRLASPDANYITNVLGITNPVHRQKLQLKALDIVLFGYRPQTSSYAKDIILITLLVLAISSYWFAVLQRKSAQKKLHNLTTHLDRLKDMEQDFTNLQKKLEESQFHCQATEGEDTGGVDCDELEKKRSKALEAERALEGRLPMLRQLLIKTFDLEFSRLNQEKIDNLKEMQEAREWVEKLRKKHSSLLSQIRSVHGSESEQIDRRLLNLKQKMERTARSLEEQQQRWSRIELLCGFSIVNSAQGNDYPEALVMKAPRPGSQIYAINSFVKSATALQPSVTTFGTHVLPSGSGYVATSNAMKSASEVFSQSAACWPLQNYLTRSEEVEDLIHYPTVKNDSVKNGPLTISCDGRIEHSASWSKIADSDKLVSVSSSMSGSIGEDLADSADSKRRLKNLKSMRLVQSKKEIDGKAQCISCQVLSDLFSSNATTDPNG